VRKVLVVSAFAALDCASAAAAPVVYVNQPGLTITSIDTSVFGAKYRLSNSNFDQSIDSGGGTTTVNQLPNFVSRDLGNLTALRNVIYSFTVRQIAGQGFVFTLTSPSNVTSTVAWGTFLPLLNPAPNASALLLPTVGSLLPTAPGAFYNSLQIELRGAQRSGTAYSPVATASDLSFVAKGMTLSTALNPSMSVSPGSNTTPNPNYPDSDSSYISQWLVTKANLALYDWTLSGRINLSVAANAPSNIDEFVKLTVTGKKVRFNGVPEPMPIATLALGLAAIGWRRRRAPAARS